MIYDGSLPRVFHDAAQPSIWAPAVSCEEGGRGAKMRWGNLNKLHEIKKKEQCGVHGPSHDTSHAAARFMINKEE